jgi:hypothetical protein
VVAADGRDVAMSVVVITPAGFEAVAELLDALVAQTIASSLETIFVGPPPVGTTPAPASCDVFAAVRQVRIDEFDPVVARRAGTDAATAPIVAFTEDHALPEPGWAEALAAAYAVDSGRVPAGVGPMVVNANPGSAISWANFLIEYGDWCLPAHGGVHRHLPGHNCSYRRSFLVERVDLDDLFNVETVAHWEAADSGERFICEPTARLRHLNHEVLGASIHLRYKCGRVFAGYRARRWPWLRRWAFALAAPLVTAIRLRRLARARRGLPPPPSAASWAALTCLTAVASVGEAVGTIAGPGETKRWNADVAVDRQRFVRGARS